MSLDETVLTVADAVCNICRNERNRLCLLHKKSVKKLPQPSVLEKNLFYRLTIVIDIVF